MAEGRKRPEPDEVWWLIRSDGEERFVDSEPLYYSRRRMWEERYEAEQFYSASQANGRRDRCREDGYECSVVRVTLRRVRRGEEPRRG